MNWAIVKNALVINIIVSVTKPGGLAAGQIAVSIDGVNPQPRIGWIYLDSKFSAPPAPTVDLHTYLTARVSGAMTFGQSLIVEYAVQNIMSGKQTSEIRQIIDRMVYLLVMLWTGSLYTALEELAQMVPDDLVTQDTINYFTNKIKTFLGIVS